MLCLYRKGEDDNCSSPPTSPMNANTTERPYPSVQTSKSTRLFPHLSHSVPGPQSTVERGCDSPFSIPSPLSPPLPSYELSGTPRRVSCQHSPIAPEFSPITNSNTSVTVSIIIYSLSNIHVHV